jgi:hypothetical protein
MTGLANTYRIEYFILPGLVNKAIQFYGCRAPLAAGTQSHLISDYQKQRTGGASNPNTPLGFNHPGFNHHGSFHSSQILSSHAVTRSSFLTVCTVLLNPHRAHNG